MRARGIAVALLAVLAAVAPARAQLGPNGTRAYDMARAADDAARAAQDEGAETLTQLLELAVPGGRDGDALKTLRAQAEAAAEALAGYRKQVQASADEAFERLADGVRGPREDAARREQLEQRALLAAYEAAVMAARARSQAERLRALHADARALLAGAGGTPARSAARPTTAAEAAPQAAPGPEVVVPNLVGARLDAATRELAAAGLRLGPTAGPREGFVVKQTPTAGARVPRQAAVSLTLSATAAGVTVLPPR